ncbi:MAG: sodium/proton-translocating pyrophosphatase, partial [Eggerthellaceae bacterium]|nr:sodium/proton-translocating pyrophosphatase [Eggerthellaceae bacterium]
MDITVLSLVAGLAAGLIAAVFAAVLINQIRKLAAGDDKMQSIASAIQEDAMAYLAREYKTVAIAAVIIAVILVIPSFFGVEGFGIWTAIGFLLGGAASAAAGYIGMRISVVANVRTAKGARGGLDRALRVAFKSGSVTGMCVIGLGILVTSIMCWLVVAGVAPWSALVGLGFGGS